MRGIVRDVTNARCNLDLLSPSRSSEYLREKVDRLWRTQNKFLRSNCQWWLPSPLRCSRRTWNQPRCRGWKFGEAWIIVRHNKNFTRCTPNMVDPAQKFAARNTDVKCRTICHLHLLCQDFTVQYHSQDVLTIFPSWNFNPPFAPPGEHARRES